MKRSLALVVASSMALALPLQSQAAQRLDVTDCYSGTAASFHTSKGVMPVFTWTQNGILASHTKAKLLENAVVHCAGIQRGLGPKRTGYGICKIVDDDGDMIIAEIPYSGFTYDMKFIEGSGKWKGVKGSLHSERTVRSKAGKGAMPGTYQGCRRERGTIELPKQ